jgi:hypothetical protein
LKYKYCNSKAYDNRCSRETSEHDAIVFCGRWKNRTNRNRKLHEPHEPRPHEPQPNRSVNLFLGSTVSIQREVVAVVGRNKV